MKKLNFIFVCLFSLTLVSLNGMESVPAKKHQNKKNLIENLDRLKIEYTNNKPLINATTAADIDKLFKLANGETKKKAFTNTTKLNKILHSIKKKMDSAIKQNAQEEQLKSMKKNNFGLPKQPTQTSTLPVRPQRITPKLVTFNVAEVQVPEAQELTPLPPAFLPSDSEPEQNTATVKDTFSNNTNTASNSLTQNSLPTAGSSLPVLSQDLDVSTLPSTKQTSSILNKNASRSLRKIITYLSGAGICTGVGIYSYYKFSPENWYRPITLGLSCIGGTTFSLLSLKNLISKK